MHCQERLVGRRLRRYRLLSRPLERVAKPHFLRQIDAITIKQTGSGDVSYIIGGGAFHAEDKIVQHNGAGTVQIKNFYANDFGKWVKFPHRIPRFSHLLLLLQVVPFLRELL